VPRDAANNLLPPTSLVRDAHQAGLVVHAWTFRNENEFLPNEFRVGDPADPTFRTQRGSPEAEYRLFYQLGIDYILVRQNPHFALQLMQLLSERLRRADDLYRTSQAPGP
jgi:glycerophosphoryl diester phosphodiesterase